MKSIDDKKVVQSPCRREKKGNNFFEGKPAGDSRGKKVSPEKKPGGHTGGTTHCVGRQPNGTTKNTRNVRNPCNINKLPSNALVTRSNTHTLVTHSHTQTCGQTDELANFNLDSSAYPLPAGLAPSPAH